MSRFSWKRDIFFLHITAISERWSVIMNCLQLKVMMLAAEMPEIQTNLVKL